jgi:hypothetical protein
MKNLTTPASKHLEGCNAGLDPASSLFNGRCFFSSDTNYYPV